MKKFVNDIYDQKDDFIVIGLTGKTGSGCTTVSKILSKGYVDYNQSDSDNSPIQNRKDNIIKKYSSKNFKDKTFQIIKPSTVIMMLFTFDKSIFFSQVKRLKSLLEVNDNKIRKINERIKIDNFVDIECVISVECKISLNKKIIEKCDDLLTLYQAFIAFDTNNKLDNMSLFEEHLKRIKNNCNDINKVNLLKYIKGIKNNYERKLLQQTRKELVNEINKLFGCKLKKKNKIFKNRYFKKLPYSEDNIKHKFNIKKVIVDKVLRKLATDKKTSNKFINLYIKYDRFITKKRDSQELPIKQLQIIGDLVREQIDIFKLPKYINLLIKSFRIHSRKNGNHCFIVLDSLKNPFEILFFKERYSAYYTFSIHTKNEIIYERFLNTDINIKSIHQKELNKTNTKKQKGSLDSPKEFNSQNIVECVQRSDIYIDNNNDMKDTLYKQIYKYLSLIIHPGLITPTKDEMIMQLALNAKFNSGCISRQVGAVVLNKYDSVRAVGWNEVPEGQMPCLLRSHNELLNNTSLMDYSYYEKHTLRKTKEFKFILNDSKNQYEETNKKGLNDSFCFKQVQNKIDGEKNQVYTRSLHAEENAFLQASKYGNTEIIGGQLFTTASPCFLCAKKAYQLGMKRIVYIEAYPDISKEQIFDIGRNIISMVHFRGAIGVAYQKLYEPIFSYKDELKALNT